MLGVVPTNGLAAFTVDNRRTIVFDYIAVIAFGMHVQLFRILRIVEPNLVMAIAAKRFRTNRAASLVLR